MFVFVYCFCKTIGTEFKRRVAFLDYRQHKDCAIKCNTEKNLLFGN